MIRKQPIDVAGRGTLIGEDVWIGTGVIIVKSAIIGRGLVIGAISFVNWYIHKYSIAFGIQARVIILKKS